MWIREQYRMGVSSGSSARRGVEWSFSQVEQIEYVGPCAGSNSDKLGPADCVVRAIMAWPSACPRQATVPPSRDDPNGRTRSTAAVRRELLSGRTELSGGSVASTAGWYGYGARRRPFLPGPSIAAMASQGSAQIRLRYASANRRGRGRRVGVIPRDAQKSAL